MRRFLLLLMFPAFLGVQGLPAAAGDWAQFRGPNASGVATDQPQVPIRIGPEQHVVWKSDLVPGHSSPVVYGDRVYVTGVADEKLLTIALDRRTGKTVWQAEAPYKTLEKVHVAGSLAQASPATDGERVVSCFGSCGLFCYDRDGKQLWHRPLGPFKNDFGAGSSPILLGDRVILSLDHDADSCLLALDKHTGRTVWKADRAEFRRGYATPVVWEVDGRKQIVVAGTLRVVGYDAETGKEVWTAGRLARLITPTPVIGPDNVLYVAGWTAGGDAGEAFDLPPFREMIARHDTDKNGRLEAGEVGATLLKERFGQFDIDKDDHITEVEYEQIRQIFGQARNAALAIRPGGRGDVSRSHVVWECTKGLPVITSPVIAAGHLFTVKDGGILACLDARTGKVVGQSRASGTGRYFSSPVIANGNIYLINQQGTLSVIAAEPEMRPVHRADFDEEVHATPAIAGGQVFLRTAQRLYCFGAAPNLKKDQ